MNWFNRPKKTERQKTIERLEWWIASDMKFVERTREYLTKKESRVAGMQEALARHKAAEAGE